MIISLSCSSSKVAQFSLEWWETSGFIIAELGEIKATFNFVQKNFVNVL